MPLVATRGAASAQGFGEFAQSAAPVYIEDVFNTFLYTGNGSTQTINNGIDLAGKGGLTWFKERSGSTWGHALFSGIGGYLRSQSTDAVTSNSSVSNTSSGFTLNDGGARWNANGTTYASWTFREQPKFFDVVTWTGDGVAGRQIAHSLGSAPGCIIVKNTNDARDWAVWHRTLANGTYLKLNTTESVITNTSFQVFGDASGQTSTVFTVGKTGSGVNGLTNATGATYVAYLFAHDAGGFGLTGTDNVISCGSFTTNSAGGVAAQNLGYEPQFIIWKQSTGVESWRMLDNMRGMFVGMPFTASPTLFPNLPDAESNNEYFNVSATGFSMPDGSLSGSATYIYIAIRRGPMRVPTTGTSVFSPISAIGSGGTVRTTGFPVDLQIMLQKDRANYINTWAADRLRGVSTTNTASGRYVFTNTTDAEATANAITRNFGSTGYVDPGFFGSLSMVWWNFGRAPSVFDVVCYTGTGVYGRTINHNLGVTPELIIVKQRSLPRGWAVYSAAIGNTRVLQLNTTAGQATDDWFANTTPTSTVFSVGSNQVVNENTQTFVAYLFASCPGVSLVGTYTGSGGTQTINCGFPGGARFVMIKRTDSTGNWWVWDTARGMVPGVDFRIPLNTTDADSNTNNVYTTSGGFQIVTAEASINASGGTYLFLAIA